MPSPIFPPDEPREETVARPAWWRRAVATFLRAIGGRTGGQGNPRGAVRDLLPRSLGGGGRGGDQIPVN